MTITIQTDDAFIMLPETIAVQPSAENCRKMIANSPAVKSTHLYPLVDVAGSFAVAWMTVPQGCESFDLPCGPWIIAIGDDMLMAHGPDAFGAASLDAAIRAADNCVLITSGPEPYPYRVAATLAAKHRRNVLLIESQPRQQEAWQARFDTVRSEPLPVFLCIPQPEAAA